MHDNFDDYLNDILDTYFSADNSTEIVLDNIMDDDDIYICLL